MATSVTFSEASRAQKVITTITAKLLNRPRKTDFLICLLSFPSLPRLEDGEKRRHGEHRHAEKGQRPVDGASASGRAWGGAKKEATAR
jgi:hypothetical protein